MYDTKQRQHWETFFGTPPSDWAEWTHQAEELLLRATGVSPTGNQGRGTTLKLSRQRISRPQAGAQAVGTNMHMSRLRLRVAQHDRLLLLEQRRSTLAEVHHLRHILHRNGYPTQADRDLLERWLQAVPKRRQKGWLDWVAQQLGRSGGKLYKWAQRRKAEDNLTTLSPAPPGACPDPASGTVRSLRRMVQIMAGWSAMGQLLRRLPPAHPRRRCSPGPQGHENR